MYESVVTHERFAPRSHRFRYRLFSFSLDLDEIDEVVAHTRLLSRNRFNLFSFYDRDHLDVRAVLNAHGVAQRPHRIQLVTSLRILGYVFNPVSFYFCFDAEGRPFAAVAEVGNTFGEMKPYVLDATHLRDGRKFDSRQRKEFYISPFAGLDDDLDLHLAVPDETLGIVINTLQGEHVLVKATMTGRRVPLSTARLIWFSVKYPLLTLKVIAAIHWEALRLWAKGIAFHRKSESPELQRGIVSLHQGG